MKNTEDSDFNIPTEIDGVQLPRTIHAIRVSSTYMQLCNDLGGESNLSVMKREIVKKIAILSLACAAFETELMKEGSLPPKELESYMQLCKTMEKLIKTIGLTKVPKDVTDLTLEDYLEMDQS